MKIFALCLMLVALVLCMTPPVYGYIPEPLLGISWRPDICADGSPGMQYCGDLYTYVVGNLDSGAVDHALNSTCSTRECYIAMYTEYMDGFGPQTCTYNFMGGSDEMESWCVDLFNVVERHAIDTLWPDPNACTGACVVSQNPINPLVHSRRLFPVQ